MRSWRCRMLAATWSRTTFFSFALNHLTNLNRMPIALPSAVTVENVTPVVKRAFASDSTATALRVSELSAAGYNNTIYLIEVMSKGETIKCVLKVVPALPQWRGKVRSEATVMRFLRNNLASESNRRLIPLVFDYDSEGKVLMLDGIGHDYLLMEYVPGIPLTDVVE
jgi:hypothetical protein